MPDESIDNVLEVLHLYNEDEHDGGQLSVAIEEPERDETDDVADESEDDATDEVGHEGWAGENVGGRTGHCDFGCPTRGEIEKRVHDGDLIQCHQRQYEDLISWDKRLVK